MNAIDLKKRLAAAGIQPTPQRLDVASVLLAEPQHLSAEQIQDALRAVGKRVSKATVYNSLRLFCERGLIREVNVDPTRVFYDSTTHAHHHFFNVDTGELSDISPGALELTRLPTLPNGTTEDSIEVLIRIRNEG